MTPEQRAAVDAVRDHGGQKPAARALGIAESTLRDRLKRARKHQQLDPGVQTAMAEAGLQDVGRLHSGWLKGENHSLYFQLEKDQHDAVLDAITTAFEEHRGAALPAPAPQTMDAERMVLYPRADFHLGMLSWGRETGHDWDLRTALDALGAAASDLVASAPPAETAVVLGLGDAFHADDQAERTPGSGHDLDVDSRYPKIVTAGVWLEIAKIKLALRKHARVIYKVLAGNHDPHASLALTIGAQMYFHEEPRVVVDDSPAARWYFRHGCTLIGATHGHRVKQQELPMIMAAERPQDWAETTCRRFYSGHMHHRRVLEHGSVLCEQFGSPAPPDAYHAAGPWKSQRGMTAICFDRDKGETGRIEYGL